MSGRTSILIPYRPSEERQPLFRLVIAQARSWRGDVEVIVRSDRGDNDDLFNHPQAINRAAAEASGDVLVIWDADTLADDMQAVQHAAADSRTDGHWRLPQRYRQLSQAATARMLHASVPAADSDCDWIGDGVSVSGIVVVPTAAFWDIGGADERYIGWGADDVALAQALGTLYRPPVRWPGDVIHLWHPRGVQENGGHRHSHAERTLTERYNAAAGNHRKMAALIAGKP